MLQATCHNTRMAEETQLWLDFRLHHGPRTIRPPIGWWSSRRAIWFLLGLNQSVALMGHPGWLAAAPHTQGTASSPRVSCCLPRTDERERHTPFPLGRCPVTPSTGDTLTLALDARYHLRNDNKEDAVSELRIDLPQAGTLHCPPTARPWRCSQQATMPIPPCSDPRGWRGGSCFDLCCGCYSRAAAGGPLPFAQIDAWPGQTSVQINVLPDASIPPAAWLQVDPQRGGMRRPRSQMARRSSGSTMAICRTPFCSSSSALTSSSSWHRLRLLVTVSMPCGCAVICIPAWLQQHRQSNTRCTG